MLAASSLSSPALLTLLLSTAIPGKAPVPSPYAHQQPEADTAAPLRVDALRATSGGLTADDVAEKAVEHAPSIQSADADIALASARVDQTVASYVPTVTLSAGYTRLSDVNVTFGSGALVGAANAGLLSTGPCPGGMGECVVDSAGAPVGAASFDIPQILNQYSLQAKLSVPISDYVLRMMRGLEAAKQSREASEIAKEAELRKVDVDARVAYYNWLRTVAQVEATKDAVATANARLDDANVGMRAGIMTTADIKRIEALVANARTTQVEAEAYEEVAREQLAILMEEPVQQWAVGEDVMGPGASPTSAGKLDDAVAEALRNRAELRALELNDRALANGIKTEKAGYYPRLDGFAEGTYANPNQRIFPQTQAWNGTWSAGLTLSWTINGPINAKQNLKELEAQQRTLNAQEQALRRGIRMEVTQAYVDRKNAVGRIKLAAVSRAATDEAYEVVSKQFAGGKATATDVIEAQGERLNSYIQSVNAHIDLRVAETKLEYAKGAGAAPK